MTIAQFSRDEIIRYQGIEQGIEQGIRAFILDKMDDQVSEERIIQKLQKQFRLSEDDAKSYIEECKKNR